MLLESSPLLCQAPIGVLGVGVGAHTPPLSLSQTDALSQSAVTPPGGVCSLVSTVPVPPSLTDFMLPSPPDQHP